MEILDRVSTGEPVAGILGDNRDKKRLPAEKTFYRWCDESEQEDCREVLKGLSQRYARAGKYRAHSFFNKVIDVAFDDSEDLSPEEKRIRIDALKYSAGRLDQNKYGDKVNHDHSGQIDLVEQLEKAEQRVIEGKCKEIDGEV